MSIKKQNEDDIPKVEKEGWEAEEIVKEGLYEESDEVVRKILRGDEEKGDPDERDIIPAPDYQKTPHGHEEVNRRSEDKSDNKKP